MGAEPNDTTTSEDCLFLNVFAPSNATTSSKLPVYFFIQGGGFASDSNPNYNGSGLLEASAMNIVVVNLNYRVGAYGFLAGQEILEGGSLNNGLLDQRKAMEWVQKYISLVINVVRVGLVLEYADRPSVWWRSWPRNNGRRQRWRILRVLPSDRLRWPR